MTWTELARRAGASSDEEADFLLWNATAFPFADVATIWRQLRHVVRHRICCDDPSARCHDPRYSVRRASTLSRDSR